MTLYVNDGSAGLSHGYARSSIRFNFNELAERAQRRGMQEARPGGNPLSARVLQRFGPGFG